LKIEEPSYFSHNMPENIPDNDIQADMYLLINQVLENLNYKRYEISNFAKPNYESRHNLNYWNNEEYYGFGLSAHGYINKTRYSNCSDLIEYIKNPTRREFKHKVNFKEQIEEEIFLGLRKEEGINLEKFKQKYGFCFEEKYNKILQKYSNYFVKTNTGYKFTTEGVLLSNEILTDFIED
ncbi:MAG: oxygen-independent coproporphyrinogen III oxidase, partial [bacterium]|nr:oxygen-independent coproporphyrinogen III oxidase [bacterium]